MPGAAVPDPAPERAPAAERRLTVTPGGGAGRSRPAVQPPLFPAASKLVDFEEYLPAEAPRRRSAAPRRARPSSQRELPGQIAFDFDSPAIANLGLDASRNRFRVASLARRSFACIVDLALAVALGVLPFLLVVRGVLAASWPADSRFYAAVAAAGWIIVALYHLLFAVAGAPSCGQRLARLRLVTLEGRPSEPPHRLWRVLFYSVFPPACLLGSVWAVLTEEKYSWADIVSRTYFTAAEAR